MPLSTSPRHSAPPLVPLFTTEMLLKYNSYNFICMFKSLWPFTQMKIPSLPYKPSDLYFSHCSFSPNHSGLVILQTCQSCSHLIFVGVSFWNVLFTHNQVFSILPLLSGLCSIILLEKHALYPLTLLSYLVVTLPPPAIFHICLLIECLLPIEYKLMKAESVSHS